MNEITSFDDLIKASKKFAWWRGESKVNLKLLPKAYRGDKLSIEEEATMYLRFQQRALQRHPNCPDFKDVPAWLFLMQHYGLHTRLEHL